MHRIIPIIAFIFVSLIAWIPFAQAQESYADVQILKPDGWQLDQMQTFSGSVPSRAWVFKNEDNAEIMVSVMVTEGILDGLTKQSLPDMMRLYLQSLIIGWGGKASEPETKDTLRCGEGVGYQVIGQFGANEYNYYGCMLRASDWSRLVTVSAWSPKDTPAHAISQNLLQFVMAVTMPTPDPTEDD